MTNQTDQQNTYDRLFAQGLLLQPEEDVDNPPAEEGVVMLDGSICFCGYDVKAMMSTVRRGGWWYCTLDDDGNRLLSPKRVGGNPLMTGVFTPPEGFEFVEPEDEE